MKDLTSETSEWHAEKQQQQNTYASMLVAGGKVNDRKLLLVADGKVNDRALLMCTTT